MRHSSDVVRSLETLIAHKYTGCMHNGIVTVNYNQHYRTYSQRRESITSKLSLKDFIQRQKVITLYRNMMRAARDLEDQTLKLDVLEQIKLEFRKSSEIISESEHATSSYISTLLVQGERELERLRHMTTSKEGNKMNKMERLNDKMQARSQLETPDATKGNLDPDVGWLEIQDNEDPRGRVGKGWPWSK